MIPVPVLFTLTEFIVFILKTLFKAIFQFKDESLVLIDPNFPVLTDKIVENNLSIIFPDDELNVFDPVNVLLLLNNDVNLPST